MASSEDTAQWRITKSLPDITYATYVTMFSILRALFLLSTRKSEGIWLYCPFPGKDALQWKNSQQTSPWHRRNVLHPALWLFKSQRLRRTHISDTLRYLIIASHPYLESDVFNVRYIIQTKSAKGQKSSLLNLYIGTSLEVVSSSIDLKRLSGHCIILAWSCDPLTSLTLSAIILKSSRMLASQCPICWGRREREGEPFSLLPLFPWEQLITWE